VDPRFLTDLGIVLTLGFFGALLVRRLGQSVITGYLLVGAIAGPHALGLIGDTALISHLSELGIIFLMFFLGLEFSVARFRRARNSVLFIGTGELLMNLGAGFFLGWLLGLPAVERMFLAGIMAMSSSGVVAKLLVELRRTATRDAEVLMGIMVFEDFVAVLYLGVLAGAVALGTVAPGPLAEAILRAVAFYGLFLWAGQHVMGWLAGRLVALESEELFTVVAAGGVLLAAAAAAWLGFAAAAGAFLLGMVVADADLESRLRSRLVPFRDVFLVLFFLAFGTLADYTQFVGLAPLVLLAVLLSLVTEVGWTSFLALVSGFGGPTAVRIGSAMVARGEYALIYAAVGLAAGVISNDLYQFTATYVFIMTVLAPVLMTRSRALHAGLRRVVPPFVRFAAGLVSVVMRPIMFADGTQAETAGRWRALLVVAGYATVVAVAFISVEPWQVVTLTAVGAGFSLWLRKLLFRLLHRVRPRLEEAALGGLAATQVTGFVANTFSAVLLAAVAMAAFWHLGQAFTLGVPALLASYLLAASWWVSRQARLSRPTPLPS